MAFDPDQYLKQTQATDFNPYEYLGQTKDTIGGAAQTALESAGDVLTLGHLPQVQAGVEKLVDAIGLGPGADVDRQLEEQGFTIEQPDSYVELRDQNIARQKQQTEQYPKAALAGTLAGLGASAPLAVSSVPASAALGAAYNPGDVEGQSVLDRPLEEGLGRLKGGAIGAALGKAGQLAGKLGKGLTARDKAIQSMKKGSLGKELKDTIKKATPRDAAGRSKALPKDIQQFLKQVDRSPISTFKRAKVGTDTAEAIQQLENITGKKGLTELSDTVTSAQRSLLDPVNLVKPLEAPNEIRKMMFRGAMKAGPAIEAGASDIGKDALIKGILESLREE